MTEKRKSAPSNEGKAFREIVSLLQGVGRDLKTTNKTADAAVKNINKAKRRLKRIAKLGRVP